jgi:hypothetical protein
MKRGRLFAGVGALGAFVAAIVAYAATPVKGFDYQDSPTVITRPSTDLSDAYLFPSPVNPNNVVAVMDIHPGLAAGTSNSTYFDQGVLYQMKFDEKFASEALGSRPVEDLVLQFSAGKPANGTQQIFAYGPSGPVQAGTVSKLVNSGQASAEGFINKIFTLPSGITVFAGSRADPFFFYLSQWYNIVPDRNQGSTNPSCLPGVGNDTCKGGFNFGSPVDYFANTNVLSIVAEIPISVLEGQSNTVVAYWATSSTQSGH